jgi:ABC-type branched-subunit amino acid transport system substrate-binding protein
MTRLAKGAYALLLALLLPIGMACMVKPIKQEYVIIGAIFPRRGDSYYEGINAINGIHVARQEINISGGILEKNMDLIVLLTENEQADALSQYDMLKEQGATAIITLLPRDIAEALEQAAKKDGMPLVDLNSVPHRIPIDRTHSKFSPPPSINDQSLNNAIFFNKYASLFHFEPTRIAALSYETTCMFCEAIKKIGNTNKNEIISIINEVQQEEQL